MRAFLRKHLHPTIRAKLITGQQKYWTLRYYWRARNQIDSIKRLPDSPFNKGIRPGFMRGIDFYNRRKLISAVALTIGKFRFVHGIAPNLLHPEGFNEKIVWSKFFSEVKIPESGNKILT